MSPRRALLSTAAAAVLAVTGVAGCSSPAGSTQRLCDSLRDGANPMALFGQYDPNDGTQAAERLAQATKRLRALHDAAPSELRSQFETLIDAARSIEAALAAQRDDPAATPTVDFDGASVVASGNEIVSFALQSCGIDLTTHGVSVQTTTHTDLAPADQASDGGTAPDAGG